MYWFRQRLKLVSSVIVSAHVAALTALSLVLCCLSHLKVGSQTSACPMHRAADESCSMADCPMHHAASTPKQDVTEQNSGDGHSRHVVHQASPKPANPCLLIHRAGDLSPELVLGVPGLLLAPMSLTSTFPAAVPLAAVRFVAFDRALLVSCPPPRA